MKMSARQNSTRRTDWIEGEGRRMIRNIIDRRKRPYRWKRINAIIEATSHDHSVDDSDQAEAAIDDIVYDCREAISLEDAIAWASGQSNGVTLYLYDEGCGVLANGH